MPGEGTAYEGSLSSNHTSTLNHTLRIFEVTVHSDGSDILTSMSVSLGTNTSKFSAAIDRASRIYVEGQVGRVKAG